MVDISVEKGGFISPNYLYKTIVSLKEQIMKTKTYPEIGFLRLRDVIGGKDNPQLLIVVDKLLTGFDEPKTVNQWVPGSSPGRGATFLFQINRLRRFSA
jgi:hypothetical protein